MQWLIANWFWVLIGDVFVGMHLLGHGCHGSRHRQGNAIEDAGPTGGASASVDTKRNAVDHHY